jgi:xanthosine utilization system XapX-like protein
MTTSQNNLIDQTKIFRITALAIMTSIVANLLVRALLFALLDLSPEFPPLSTGAVAILTTFGAGLAGLVFSIIARRSPNPVATFRLVALVALVISVLPNLALVADPAAAPFPFPGGTPLAYGVLMIFHLVAAIICVALLTTQTRH